MKQTLRFLTGTLCVLLLGTMTVWGQITIDGTFDGTSEWGEPVSTNNSGGWQGYSIDSLFVASDETHIYFAVFLDNVADWHSYGILVNTTSGGGSDEVWGYQIDYAHSDLPDYVIKGHFGNGGSPYSELRSWNSGSSSWDGSGNSISSSNFSSDDGNDVLEFKISRSSLGSPDTIDVQIYLSGNNSGEHGSFNSVPVDEEADTWNESSAPNQLDNYATSVDVSVSVVTTTSSGNWSSTSTWTSGSVPSSGDAVQLDHDVTLDTDATVSQLTVSNSITFTASDGSARTLTIQDGGALTVDGTFTSSDGTVSFLGAGSVTDGTNLENVDIAGGVAFGSSSTIGGTLTIKSGGYLASSSGGSGLGSSSSVPNYDSNAILRFEGTFSFGTSGDNYAGGFGTTTNKVPSKLEIGSSADLTINGDARTLSGSLEIESGGALTTNDLLTLKSGAIFTGSSSSITGDLIIQRIISGDAGWRMLSFPNTGGTVADISDDTAIQGVTDGDNSGSASNFMTYDSDGSFETPTNTTTAIGNGYGFITYFYNNTTAGSSELPITLDVSGSEPSSEVSVNLNKTTLSNGAYYTLVGNPFASNYNLNGITVTGGAINNNVQFWDDGAGSYATHNRTDPFIASPWQGFWVEVASGNGATSIEFPTTGKSTSDTTATYFSKANSQKGDVHFELSSENSFDKAIRLSFRESAEIGWDLDDASKFIPLVNSYATIGFVGEERVQSVFSLPYDLQENYEIEMQESLVGVSGEFTLSWEGMETIPDGVTLEFHDYKTGETVDMSMVSSYTFEATETAEKRANPLTVLKSPVAEAQKAKSTEEGRFGITVKAKSTTSSEPIDAPEAFTLEQNYPNPFNPTTSIQYSVAEAGAVSLTIYNVMGQKVETLVSGTKAAGTYRVSWDAADMASGIYYYRLSAGNQVLTRQMTLIK